MIIEVEYSGEGENLLNLKLLLLSFIVFVFSLLFLVVLSGTVIPWFIFPSIFTLLGMADP